MCVWIALLTAPAQVVRARPLVIGTIGGTPSDQIEHLAPLATYLAAPLRSDGIDSARVVVAESVPEMAQWLRDGRVDVYVDTPFPALAVSDLAGSRLMLRCAAEEESDSRSVIFTLKSSGIGRLEELKGHTIAFAGPFSTFGFLLPKLTLGSRGVTVRDPMGEPAYRDETAASYVFSGDDETTVVWVLRGKVSAGAVSADSYRRYARQSQARFRVIEETAPLPAWIVSLRGTLPDSLLGRLTEELAGMKDREDGRRVLRDGPGFQRCDLASEQMLDPVIRSRPFVRAQFGIR